MLLTTRDRLSHFADSGVFGEPVDTNPSLEGWPELRPKVVASIDHALRSFPHDPSRFRLDLEVGGRYPRDPLLETLIDFGFERDALPGVTVRGDTITLYLDDSGERELRLEFFGDDLDSLKHDGQALERFVLATRSEVPAGDWTDRLLEHLPGTVFLDAPELYPGELANEAASAWLWDHLAERPGTSFGRDPLAWKAVQSELRSLPYYRGEVGDLANDLETWLKDGFSVSLQMRFERSGRYLQERVIDQLDSHWRNTVGHHPGQVGLLLAGGARGGFLDPTAREVVITEDLLYGHQGGRKLKRLRGKSVHDATQLSRGDYLIHPDHGIGRFRGLEPRTVVGVTRDYLILQYSGEGKLYLPVEQLPLLRRHSGTTDDPPRLSTLGTNEWARARERARVERRSSGCRTDQDVRRSPGGRRRSPAAGCRLGRAHRREPPLPPHPGSGDGGSRHPERSRAPGADGPADLRRRGLWQDRGGHPRRPPGRRQRQTGRHAGAHHGARQAAL